MNIKIISFQDHFTNSFYELNIEWLEAYFYVEEFDREVLSNPKQYIINKGGHIFFAIENHTVIGTVALMKSKNNNFELTKMAITPEKRGNKIGQLLMKYCIDFATKNNFEKIILYSNTMLENAIYIYKKHGFIEIPMEEKTPYKRSNIKMELVLNNPYKSTENN